ncbi:NAD(P)/FAD-dependent oxidoreductase [Streptomyces sp. NRRL B-3229]|uniref:NAD(P)/FAD-dependent oxidoreductase n=1 Tax=Streptomyces sp. NRRL B-3229 TaxID=1463836 RepID=UPI0004BE87AC|nr:FAD-dependent oxidoreductase [Streptomyces sp. NRRL B-3229]
MRAERDRAAVNRIVVVGASVAGLTAAETLRREGYKGTLTLVGDEPHLPYDRPPLSKQLLTGQWDADRLTLRSETDIDVLRLDLRLRTAATGLDLAGRLVRLADGTRVPYDGLVIATGVRPRRLPGDGAHVLRTLDDALALRDGLEPGRRLVVVGAGFLGAEAASVARSRGCDVVLLEPAPVPLAHAVGEQVGEVLAQSHRDHGVTLRCGVTVTQVSSNTVTLADGEVVEGDAVLVAVGSVPSVDWLADSGLDVGDGVVCDEYCRAAPGVYAAGDVARWHNPLFGLSMRIEHRTNAAEQAMAAARNLLRPDGSKPFAPVPYFWSDQYDVRVQAYGWLRGHEEVAVVDGDLAQHRFLAAYRGGDRLVGAVAVGMPPKAIHRWQQAIAARAPWRETVTTAGQGS